MLGNIGAGEILLILIILIPVIFIVFSAIKKKKQIGIKKVKKKVEDI